MLTILLKNTTRSLSHISHRCSPNSQTAEISRPLEPSFRDDEAFATRFAPRRTQHGTGKRRETGNNPNYSIDYSRYRELEYERESNRLNNYKKRTLGFHDSQFLDDEDFHGDFSTLQSAWQEEKVEEHFNDEDFDNGFENISSLQDGPKSNVEDWSAGRMLRRRRGRLLDLSKSWDNNSPNLLLKGLLITRVGDEELRKKTAITRSMRMPVVLMQMMIRNEELAKPEGSELLELLPNEATWQKIMDIIQSNGYTQQDLDHYLKILTCGNDQQRIALFLSHDTFKPMWLFNFITRRRSNLSKSKTIVKLIDHLERRLLDVEDEHAGTSQSSTTERSRSAKLNMTLDNFALATTLMAHHCMRLEPRLLVKVANLIANYIRTLQLFSDRPQMVFHRSCRILNHGLELFQPRAKVIGQRDTIPNAYFWEAQRILLDTSSSLSKPLSLSKSGFQAVRVVLAGLRKNKADIHSAALHSETWPPYLRPGDGMDERMDPEESWSRTVRAGMMMQEAGFPKEEVDEALDILQGLAPDGTPTIQQRVPGVFDQRLSVWAASIRATRNAQEAWIKFQQPIKKGEQPSIGEYAVMFEKLFARDADPKSGSVPGDNSLNYSTHEPNLADFEKARLKPPSVDELYQRMKLSGIKPSRQCLGLLVSNAESLDTAHRYLLESDTASHQYGCLLADNPDPQTLRSIPSYLFSAYINVCAREGKGAKRQLSRAIRLTALRLDDQSSSPSESLWLPILKNLGQHRASLGMTLREQLSLVLMFLQRARAADHVISLSMFRSFTRCLQKILRLETRRLATDLDSNNAEIRDELLLLYNKDAEPARKVREQAEAAGFVGTGEVLEPDSNDLGEQTPLFLVGLAAFHIKGLFNTMVSTELEIRTHVKDNEVSAFDAMVSRRDPVRARYVYDYVLLLAYTGEFQELARVVRWAIQEWSQPDVVEDLQDMDHLPQEANLFETLCAFRAFAEPMLPRDDILSVLEMLNSSQMGWAWPDDEMVEAYVDGNGESVSYDELRRLLLWIRQGQLRRQQTEQSQY